MIYADNAATTKLDMDAFEAMRPFLLEEYGNASQPYSFSRTSRRALKDARMTIAECIGALPEEIYFTSGGTESDNWAIKMGAGCEGEVITSSIEHHAVLNSCRALERAGRSVSYLPVTREGIVCLETLESVISERTKLVSIMYVNNEVGSIQPIRELARAARQRGSCFHTDAVQGVGHIPIDVQEAGVDMLSASGHKFNGPKGVGFLYIKNGTGISAFMDGGSQERQYRAGTENVAAIAAMAVALRKNCLALGEAREHLGRLEHMILDRLRLSGVDFIRNGGGKGIPGNMSLSFRTMDGETLLHRLDLKGICVSTGSACDGTKTQVSHVLRAMKVPLEYARGTIRISLGVRNTEEEALRIAQSLIDILK